jgi:hypothetical protein
MLFMPFSLKLENSINGIKGFYIPNINYAFVWQELCKRCQVNKKTRRYELVFFYYSCLPGISIFSKSTQFQLIMRIWLIFFFIYYIFFFFCDQTFFFIWICARILFVVSRSKKKKVSKLSWFFFLFFFYIFFFFLSHKMMNRLYNFSMKNFFINIQIRLICFSCLIFFLGK